MMSRYNYPHHHHHPQSTLLSPVADDESKYNESLATPNEITSGRDDHARPQEQQQRLDNNNGISSHAETPHGSMTSIISATDGYYSGDTNATNNNKWQPQRQQPKQLQQPNPQEYTQQQQQQQQQHGRMVEQDNWLIDSHQRQGVVPPTSSSVGAQRALRKKATKYFHKTSLTTTTIAHPASSRNNEIDTHQRTNKVNVPTTPTIMMSNTHKSTMMMINASSPNSLDTLTTMELSTATTNESPISPITSAPPAASLTTTMTAASIVTKSNGPSRSMTTTTTSGRTAADTNNPSTTSLLLRQEFRLQHEHQQQELSYHKQRREQQQRKYQQHPKEENGHRDASSSMTGNINSTTRSQTQQLTMDDAAIITPKDARRLLWDKNERLITKLPLKPPSLYGCHTTTTTTEDGAQVVTTTAIASSINNINEQYHLHHGRNDDDNNNNFRPHRTLRPPKPPSLTIPTLNYNDEEDYNNSIDDPPLQYYESRSNVSGYSSAGSDLENAARRILLSRGKKNAVGGGGRSWSAERLGGGGSQYRSSGSDSECSIISGTGSITTGRRCRDYVTNTNGTNDRGRVQQRTPLPTGWRERIHRKTGREVPRMAKSTAPMMAAKTMKGDSSNTCGIMTTSMQHQHDGAVDNLIRGSRDVSSNGVVNPSHHQPPPPQLSTVASLAAAAAQSWSRPIVPNPSPVVTKSSYSNAVIGNIISDQTIYNQSGNIDQKQHHQRQQQLITSPPSSQNTELDESMYHLDDLQKGGIFPNYHRFYSQSLEDSTDRVSDFSPPFPTNGNNIDDPIIINQYGFPRYSDSTNCNEICEGRISCTEGGEVLPPPDSKQRRSVRFTILPAKNIQHEGGGGGGGGQRRGDGESNNNTGDGCQYAKQPHQQQQQHQTQRENYEENSAENMPAATNGNDHVGHGNWEEIQSLTVDWKRAISPERKNYAMEEFSTLQTSSEMELFAWNDDIRDYNREMSQGNNNPDSPSRPRWKVRKDAKNDRQRTLSELQVEYNDAKKQELLSQSPSLHHRQNFQREQQTDSAYSRWIDSQFATSSGVDLPPQVRMMPDTFDVNACGEELHARKSRSRMKLDLRSSSREKRQKDAVIMPTGKSTNDVECEPYYFTDGDVPDSEHDMTSGSPSSWKRFGLFRSKSPKRRQYYSDGERFDGDWLSSGNAECGRSKKTTKKKKPPTSLVASPPRSLSRLRSPMRMRGQKDNSNAITDNKEFIVMNDSMSIGGKHDNVSKIVDMTTGGEISVETIAQWDEVESQIQEPPIFEDEEPNTPISELTDVTNNMSIVPSTRVVQSIDLRDNQMTVARSKLLGVPHLSVPQTLTNNVNSPRALAANANHADIPRFFSQHYGTSLLDDTLNTSGFDEARSVVSFDADALGSLDTMVKLPSKSMALAASARSPRSIRSRDASNAYNSNSNTTLMELNEIERLRGENELLKEELENVSQLSMKVSKMYTECLKLENVRLRVSKECLISQEVAASESIIHKLDVIAEEIDKTNTLKEGRKKKKKQARKLRVRHAPNPTVINDFNNLLPVAHLINGVDFDDDTVTTVSTHGGHETTPELLKRTCSSIVATTAILASQVKTSLNQQSDASASRPMDCFNHCRRKTGNYNVKEAATSIARKKTNMTASK